MYQCANQIGMLFVNICKVLASWLLTNHEIWKHSHFSLQHVITDRDRSTPLTLRSREKKHPPQFSTADDQVQPPPQTRLPLTRAWNYSWRFIAILLPSAGRAKRSTPALDNRIPSSSIATLKTQTRNTKRFNDRNETDPQSLIYLASIGQTFNLWPCCSWFTIVYIPNTIYQITVFKFTLNTICDHTGYSTHHF